MSKKDTTPDTQWGRPPRNGGFIRFITDKRDRALLVMYGNGPFTVEKVTPGKCDPLAPSSNCVTASLTLQQMARLRDSLTDFLAQAEVEAQRKKGTAFLLEALPDCRSGINIRVIKTIREHTGLGLKEAVNLVRGIPSVVDTGDPATAAALFKALEELGAKVQ